MLWTVASVLQIGSSALSLIDIGQLRGELLAEVAKGFPAESAVTQERVVFAVLLLLLGSGVLVALLQLGFARVMGKGKRWARIALVPLAALGLVHAVIVFGALSSAFLAGLLLAAGVALAALAVMLLPGNKVWFKGERS